MDNRINKILYLEEAPNQDRRILELLHNKGIRPILDVVSSQESFRSAILLHPDLILVSDSHSVLSPDSVLDIMRAERVEVPVIILAENPTVEAAVEFIKKGFSDLLHKDNLEKLPGVLRKISAEIKKKVDGQREVSRKDQLFIRSMYNNMFQLNPLPNWIFDQDSLRILDVNQAAIEHYGYSRKEFLRMSILDLRPKEEVPFLVKFLERTKKIEAIRFHGKFTHLKKDQTRITVDVYVSSMVHKNVDCRLVVCIDVTEKEDALRELEEKRARLLTAQRIAGLGHWELDIRTQTYRISEEMYILWGRERKDSDNDSAAFRRAIHPEDRKKFYDAQEASVIGEKEHDLEYRIVLPDQSIKWVHERGRVLKEEEGKAVIMERTVQDITDRKLFLEQLMLSETRHRGIVNSQTNYVTRTDLKGAYTYVNNKFVEDFGWLYRDNEALGNNSLTSVKEHHHQRLLEVVTRCITFPNQVFQVEIDKPFRNGSVRTTLWEFICLLDANEEPFEIQCVGIDISARVKAQQALVASNARYELVSEATSDAIWDYDLSTGSLFWGKAYSSLFGYQPEPLSPLKKSWESHIHPEDLNRVSTSFCAAIEGNSEKWREEYRYRKFNGDYAYVTDRGYIIRDANKKALRMVGAMQDVTEKKKLEYLLEKANSLSRIGSFEMDLVNEKIFWSSMTKEIHEVPFDFVPKFRSILTFYKKSSRKKILYAFREAVEKKEARDLDLQIITANGKELWVRVIVQPEFFKDQCVRLNGSFQDIDKFKKVELDLLEAYEEKDTILESIEDAFFTVNHNWTVSYWNRQAEKLLDCKKERILNNNLWEVFPELVNTSFHQNHLAAQKGKSKRHFEAHFERTDKWYDVTAYPSQNNLSVYFKDITERKRSETKLLELNKSLQEYTEELVAAYKGLEQFSFIVSHNLRAPVANILGLADLLSQEDYPAEIKENLQKELLNNVTRLDDVITDLNSILQVKKEKSERKEPVDLQDIIQSIKESISAVIEREQAEISVDLEGIREIFTVRSYLYSILYNLISNSIKYRRPEVSPKIRIEASIQEESLLLSVSDNGLGIDLLKKKDQVFSLYKRFHDHVQGKGMGLFMVKTQVEMLGGKISISSEINKGTSFYIEFKNINLELELADDETTGFHNS